MAERISPQVYTDKYHTIQGTPSLAVKHMKAMFQKRGGRYKIIETTDEAVEMSFTSKFYDGEFKLRLTKEEFIKSGVAMDKSGNKLKDNWRCHPRRMLRARCFSEGIGVVDPEATFGGYTEEEVMDFPEHEGATFAGVAEVNFETPFTEAKVVEQEEVRSAFAQAKTTAEVGTDKTQEAMGEKKDIDTAHFRQQGKDAASSNELIVRMRRLLDGNNANQAFTNWLVSINQIAAGAHWDTLQNVDIMQRAIDNPVKFLEAIGAAAQRGGAA